MAKVALPTGSDMTSTLVEDALNESLFDPALFLNHLQTSVSPLLEVSPKDLAEAFAQVPDRLDKCKKFANDASQPIFVIAKEKAYAPSQAGGLASEASPTENGWIRYSLRLDVFYSALLITSLVLIKRVPVLDPSKSLCSQVTVVQLPGPAMLSAPGADTPLGAASAAAAAAAAVAEPQTQASFFETVHAFIHHAVAPYFNAYVANRTHVILSKEGASSDHLPATSPLGTRAAGDDLKGIPAAKKKFAELELTLRYLQQNVDIPDIQLHVHPLILETLAQCRERGVKASPDALPPHLIADSSFLNKLQSEMNAWIKEIQKVTKLAKDPTFGSVSQEINFWLSMERGLEKIEKQLKSPSIQFVLDVLKQAKRFHATVSFSSDTGLQESMDTIHKYNILMKEFPIDALLSATDFTKLNEGLEAIFAHIGKKAKLSMYPVQRLLALVEALSKDLTEQALNLLKGPKLMSLPFADFESVTNAYLNVFKTWDACYKEFGNLARDITRKRNDKYLPIKIQAHHLKLQERVLYVRHFRHQHEHLEATISRVMQSSKLRTHLPTSSTATSPSAAGTANTSSFNAWNQENLNALQAVDAAYAPLRALDVLDVSMEGAEVWARYEKTYNERVGCVENIIIMHLRDTLATAKNANEMFRVFSKFNALFVRQKIRAAIQEYQAQLIETVKEDIKKLQDKFRLGYPASEAYRISMVRDIPPVSGAITWARQIERQLETYMQHVEDVLGHGWESHPEGHKLAQDFLAFKKKLNTTVVFEQWVQDTLHKDLKVTGCIFDIVRNRTHLNTVKLQLEVAFDPQIITLAKEVRHLRGLGYVIPIQINHLAKEAKRIWPIAVSLKESIRTYQFTLEKLDSAHQGDVGMLIAGFLKDAQTLIASGIQFKWETLCAMDLQHDAAHQHFVRSLEETVSLFQDKVDGSLLTLSEIKTWIHQLETCPYHPTNFKTILSAIQSHVDELNLGGYSNLDHYVANLDKALERVLKVQLEKAINKWLHAFSTFHEEYRARPGNKRKAMSRSASKLLLDPQQSVPDVASSSTPLADMTHEETLPLQSQIHEMCMQNRSLFLSVPLEATKAKWMAQFQEWMAILCNQTRIQSAHYKLLTEQSPIPSTFRSLLEQLSETLLPSVYNQIDSVLTQAFSYIQTWMQYQALWELEPSVVYDVLGDDLQKWQQVLEEVKRGRSTFDVTDTVKSFGPLVIDFEQVQGKVNAKYDQWQREMMLKFSTKLGNTMRERYLSMSQARAQLEAYQFESASTSDSIAFIILLHDIKRKVALWNTDMNLFISGQRYLQRQRFSFPSDWLYLEQIEGEWSAFNDMLQRKDRVIHDQLTGLQSKIMLQHKGVQQSIVDLLQDWEQNKPRHGELVPETALQTIQYYETKMHQLQSEWQQLMHAKDALNLLPTTTNDLSGTLTVAMEELRDLKELWHSLNRIHQNMSELKDWPWSTLNPRKVRLQLEQFVEQAKALPTKLRQYAAYEYSLEQLQSLLNLHPLVTELRSEAMKERHWKSFLKEVRVTVLLNELTLGQVWAMDLRKNEATIKQTLAYAQGELALETFLVQVREAWSHYALELVQYQSKCRLIKGWDDLFKLCSEHLSSLQTMKLSPYYRTFEEEASSWEQKLNKVQLLFDVWIDVQRQWVYLEGAFSYSSDIKHLLPVEVARFQNINTEFMTIMKKVYKSPFVMDVLAIVNIQKTMERLADLLKKIQRALGEYLEKERQAFPRLYFVGDEDLLEMIGNAKDVDRVQKHLKKMFAGIHTLGMNSEETHVLFLQSREGEVIQLKDPVEIRDQRLNVWLLNLEKEMQRSLLHILGQCLQDYSAFKPKLTVEPSSLSSALPSFFQWMDSYPAQLIVLAAQIAWTASVETSLAAKTTPQDALNTVGCVLDLLAHTSSAQVSPVLRKKCEHLITETVHQREVLRHLVQANVKDLQDFRWLYYMRFYYQRNSSTSHQVRVCIADAQFVYGFEYLGVSERLVQTPLTDRTYLSLTQALYARLGGSPFGPAGTGKTESVKALGSALGKLVLVFCCDDTFDFQAMGRIFVGLCMAGAWGCFDEFNRLEERILSAVSQQIQSIQSGLHQLASNENVELELLGKAFPLHPDTGIFITMNPGYAGRRHLPDNLKKLFRSVAMTSPDREIIAQVMLFSQGFRTAETLASKIVPFFDLCLEQLSHQSHYDFGLRALKSVLISAGQLKRGQIASTTSPQQLSSDQEQLLLIQSISETILPKLVASDLPLIQNLLEGIFPRINYQISSDNAIENHIRAVCDEQFMECTAAWLNKIMQLYQLQKIHHGIMLVGPSATGKTTHWKVLLAALERKENVESVSYLLHPKAISKERLFGTLDLTTREWVDGLFTRLLRKIIENVRGEASKRHWIIFDGDVDPEWIETLNSLLDDNKLLTLPNGERLSLPGNVRIVFEVDTLKHATPATVSRCGMIWYSDDMVTPNMMCSKYLHSLTKVPLELSEDAIHLSTDSTLRIQSAVASILTPYMQVNGLIQRAIQYVQSDIPQIMEFTISRALTSLFPLLNKAAKALLEYEARNPDLELSLPVIESFVSKKLLLSLVWSMAGAAKLEMRLLFCQFLAGISTFPLPPSSKDLLDYDVQLPLTEWVHWSTRVPQIEMATHSVPLANVVVPTIDTIRLEHVLSSWLSEHRPLLLCGPPGSGKTMTLLSALRKLPDMEVVNLNFSSATSPDHILKALDQYAEYKKTPSGYVLSPRNLGKWLILFCDEINLPARDIYESQPVISLLRQMIEWNGFWSPRDYQWVHLERIQFVGACNPPTDPGRVPLSHRFLRHVPLLMVDYPVRMSLHQIYSTFCRALLKLVPSLRGYSEALTNAMVDFYLDSQKHFTPDLQPHYVYSPRELTRWVRGIFEAIKDLDDLSVEGLVRIWAHEGLRLFQDRLVGEAEIEWTNRQLDKVALNHFPGISSKCLQRPILFSNWLSKLYLPVEQEALREFVRARLRVFYEEELEVPLVLFNHVLEHVLRIDRVLRQIQGHLLLIGVSGSGKTTLARFVAWMNGYSVLQIQTHSKYTSDDFDEDLRQLLRRCGCKGEKVCFILDETNMINSSFLERMNTLLANAEVPGLFEGDEYASLIAQCKEVAAKDGLLVDTPEELYAWFIKQTMKNLHVVFTMNTPGKDGLSNLVSTSPALFNRCVVDWFGDWNNEAFYEVAKSYTDTLDMESPPSFVAPETLPFVCQPSESSITYRDTVLNAFVCIHEFVCTALEKQSEKQQGKIHYCTPRHYLDFTAQFVRLFKEKRETLEDEQHHLNVGLDKIQETVSHVEELRASLAATGEILEKKTNASNEKLVKMVAEQQEAEQKKISLEQMSKALDQQTSEIQKRKQSVIAELAMAEPAVEAAKVGVSGIKKQHLTEVRTMGNPPEAVKLAMESVCTLIGCQIDSWKSVQAAIRRDDFISSIVNYDTGRMMTRHIREKMKRDYLSNPIYTYETVNHASKACGPLVQWVLAQMTYSEILDKVGPLREEVKTLEQDAVETKSKLESMNTMLLELEKSIGRYKEEYAVLISEIQNLKSEMDRVKSKVDRSVALLSSLSIEKNRWDATSRSFGSQMSTLVGDVVLCAAYLAYCGPFDQHSRAMLWSSWQSHLQSSHIPFKKDLSVLEYLCSADQRLKWHANALPKDDLCLENALMMDRYNRYPLIIDPSGQATEFITNQYKDKRVIVTSFLDDSFLKHLESALRFGNPILIQDVENMDPMLNPILNRELHRTGGRVLIRLGNTEIDFSPTFSMILVTRDPAVHFPSDICSRVNIISFTVTKASLQVQCLNQLLLNERTDVEQKRIDILKLQSEFTARLRMLEKGLLQTLNESKGNILEDDRVLAKLEELKAEAAEVQQKALATDQIMEEIGRVTKVYTPFAKTCASIFFAMERLSQIYHVYQFSLDFFNEIFHRILQKPSEAKLIDHQQRLNLLIISMFNETFRRVSRALKHADHLLFAANLAQIYLSLESPQLVTSDVFTFLVGSNALTPMHDTDLSSAQVQGRLELLSNLSSFQQRLIQHVPEHKGEWVSFMEGITNKIPECWEKNSNATVKSLLEAILCKAFRTDLFQNSLGSFISEVFQHQFLLSYEQNLFKIITEEVSGMTPLAFCSTRGMDASSLVEHLCAEMGVPIASVAMGTSEGYALADKEITKGLVNGGWILLKNVHLAPKWLSHLEKRLHMLRTTHTNFRLLLTMEVTPNLPVSLLRHFRIFLFEPRPGIRANLIECLRTVQSIPSLMQQGPAEKSRIYFLLCWLHSVLIERQRYIPLGWSKKIAFNDADFESALHMADSWVTQVAQGRNNIAPDKLPFAAMSTLLKETIYGGKVDTEMDQSILDSFVNQLFQAQVFESSFNLAQDLQIPSGTKLDQFLEWAQTLPEKEQAGWLGLPSYAEQYLSAQLGHQLQKSLYHIRQSELESEALEWADTEQNLSASLTSSSGQLANNPSLSQKAVLALVHEWLHKTNHVQALKLVEQPTNPITSMLQSEFIEVYRIYEKVHQDMLSLQQVLSTSTTVTLPQTLRAIYRALELKKIPETWVVSSEPIHFWIQEFSEKIRMLTVWLQGESTHPIWIGSLAHPEALFTAARQMHAQKYHVSLEHLRLELNLEGEGEGVRLSKIHMESCEWDSQSHQIVRSKGQGKTLPVVTLSFTHKSLSTSGQVRIPVYSNNKRSHLLFYVWLPSQISSTSFIQNGAALITT